MTAPGPAQVPVTELLGHLAAGDAAALVDLVLETMHRVTGFESTYLTFVDWAAETQSVTHARNAGELEVPEGAVVAWPDTLCRRALISGIHATADADADFGSDNAGHDLGIVSYVSVPVVTHDRGIFGTLCAASSTSQPLDDGALELLRLFAHLIGRQIDGDVSLDRERERAAHAKQRMTDRMMMVAESEHRVKTPLAVIRGAASVLDEHWVSLSEDRRREMVVTIARRSDELLDCVEVLLAQAREEMDELAVSRTALFVEPILTEVVTDHDLAAPDHTIAWVCDGPVVARIDAVSLQQIIGHLIDNAVKYTPAGGHITVTARVERDHAVLTVADDGPGLPGGLDPFAPFTRGADAAKQRSGSGLGLHIVRTIVTRLGGQVSAHNPGGGGAEFVVELPGA